MSALLDSLAAGFQGDGARRAALDAALRDGLPARAESWKYTNLRALDRRRFAPAGEIPAFEASDLALPPAPRLVFVNGRLHEALSDVAGLPAGVSYKPLSRCADAAPAPGYERADQPFARLNAVLAQEGATLRVEAGVDVAVPLHLVLIGAPSGADSAWHLRHSIDVGERARVTLIEHRLAAAAHSNLSNEIVLVRVASGAVMRHARLQVDADGATAFLRTEATLARDAEYRRLDLELGAALSRHELNIALQGQGARLVANGVLLAVGKRHLDTRVRIEHLARDSSCDLTWRGLGAGRGRGVFHGGIVIHEGADGSAAMLSTKNLLLSEGAEIDAQPVLEIHADEVKAAHGAAVGRLDETALFYLRSRGLPAAQARALLTAAFCREALSVLEAPAHDALEARLDEALSRIEVTS